MRIIAALLLIGSLHAEVYAVGLVDAEHAMRAGNYAEAYCVLRPMAEQGYAEAQYNIGWMYHNGYGLSVNDTLALEWWRRASDQGHVDSSFSIANLYNHGGRDVDRDSDKALDYFLRSAESGHDDAILILRSMLIRDDIAIRERRQGIVKDYGYLFGHLMQVKVPRANLRAEASIESDIVTRLEQGALVLVLDSRNKWSQVAVTGTAQVAWLYSPLLENIAGDEQQTERDDAVSTDAGAQGVTGNAEVE